MDRGAWWATWDLRVRHDWVINTFWGLNFLLSTVDHTECEVVTLPVNLSCKLNISVGMSSPIWTWGGVLKIFVVTVHWTHIVQAALSVKGVFFFFFFSSPLSGSLSIGSEFRRKLRHVGTYHCLIPIIDRTILSKNSCLIRTLVLENKILPAWQ